MVRFVFRHQKLWLGGNRPGWRRSRCKSCTGCSLSRSHRQSWGKGGRKGRAGSRERWRENTQGTLRMSMDGMTMEDKCERLEPCEMWCEQVKQCNYRRHAGVLKSASCARLRASRHSRNYSQWSHRCWKWACSRTHFSVATCHSHLFVNFCMRMYCIYKNPSFTNDSHDLPQWFHVFANISYKYCRVIVNRQRHHNIRNGIMWAQTGHSTSTCTATLCVIELSTQQKFESLKKQIRSDENRIRIF